MSERHRYEGDGVIGDPNCVICGEHYNHLNHEKLFTQKELDDAKKEAAEAGRLIGREEIMKIMDLQGFGGRDAALALEVSQRQLGPCGKHPRWAYAVDAKIEVPSVGEGDDLVGTLERHSCTICRDLDRERAAVLLAARTLADDRAHKAYASTDTALGDEFIEIAEDIGGLSTDDSRAALAQVKIECQREAEKLFIRCLHGDIPAMAFNDCDGIASGLDALVADEREVGRQTEAALMQFCLQQDAHWDTLCHEQTKVDLDKFVAERVAAAEQLRDKVWCDALEFAESGLNPQIDAGWEEQGPLLTRRELAEHSPLFDKRVAAAEEAGYEMGWRDRHYANEADKCKPLGALARAIEAAMLAKEQAVAVHIKGGAPDGCQCEPCIAARTVVEAAIAEDRKKR